MRTAKNFLSVIFNVALLLFFVWCCYTYNFITGVFAGIIIAVALFRLVGYLLGEKINNRLNDKL